MKVYVQGYRTTTEEEREKMRRLRPLEDYGLLVSYSELPEWSMERYGVDMHFETLHNKRIHVGSHYCDLSIEELPDGKFTIVCLEHPELHSK
jgi:hypothetical protein